jgi:magnesium chelatase family protein
MITRTTSATPLGVEARPVHVEVEVRKRGIPHFTIVGLADTAVRESRDRVRAALRSCGFDLEVRPIVINLAPADLRKEGNHLDLAIALALLAAYEKLDRAVLDGRLFCGELGLDGSLRPIRGALPIAELALEMGSRELLLPRENASQAACVHGAPAFGARGLQQALQHLQGTRVLARSRQAEVPGASSAGQVDLADVRGQETAKRALEVAAAGGHNLLFVGPPGCGKTMLARRMPSLLPPLSRDEAIEVTKIHSLVDPMARSGLVRDRPFRAPHSTTSTAGLIGGGSRPLPGEVSLAHAGVLFLDELPEFRRDSLESLRQPMEDGTVTIVRARARMEYPSRFALLAAMNPCPCGYLGDPAHDCRCGPPLVERYRRKISGPLLDRIDMQVLVPAQSYTRLRPANSDSSVGESNESSAVVAERVARARERQRLRFPRRAPTPFNASLDRKALEKCARLDPESERFLARAFEQLALSARSMDRVLRVARTLADLEGADRLSLAHLAEALHYRTLDRESSLPRN